MRKILCIAVVVILLSTLIPTVSAEGISQTFDLVALGDKTLVFKAQEAPTFWEKPTLKAGEFTEHIGAFLIRNKTGADQKIGLRTVELPYDNEEALRYLNHIIITVKSGDTVLYEGPYSRINDDGGLEMNIALPADGNAAYTIDLRCDYAYSGSGLGENDLIQWQFFAVVEEEEPVAVPFSDSALYEVILACGIAVIVLVGTFASDRFWKKQKG